jgi:hypothetical protein
MKKKCTSSDMSKQHNIKDYGAETNFSPVDWGEYK